MTDVECTSWLYPEDREIITESHPAKYEGRRITLATRDEMVGALKVLGVGWFVWWERIRAHTNAPVPDPPGAVAALPNGVDIIIDANYTEMEIVSEDPMPAVCGPQFGERPLIHMAADCPSAEVHLRGPVGAGVRHDEEHGRVSLARRSEDQFQGKH
ncbi:hypothetical protein I6B53_00060 [Schaalia sp. 19OD2882]|uniref:hypothetical protein n=1 Tax=Schaalia sp. 19OD2882 TaxID=2794089 RepID=UPI001C1EFC3D|nr:hypothetical protein [Schaalia sp. 19OD2882]QWW19583.1 hypothetical protein I6B53_00060 [Schaalia sp. 19OD2882]